MRIHVRTPCQRLETRGQVHGVAVSRVALACAAADVASEHRRRSVTPMRTRKRSPAKSRATTLARIAHAASNALRPMARVLDGNVERGHHAVPGKLRADVVVLADDPRDFVEIRVDHLDRARRPNVSVTDVKPATSANSTVALNRQLARRAGDHRVHDRPRKKRPKAPSSVARSRSAATWRMSIRRARSMTIAMRIAATTSNPDSRTRLTVSSEVGFELERDEHISAMFARTAFRSAGNARANAAKTPST